MAIAAQADEIPDAATFLDRLGPDPERQELIGGRVVMTTDAKAGDVWRYEDLAGGGRLVIDALGIEVPLDEVYHEIL